MAGNGLFFPQGAAPCNNVQKYEGTVRSVVRGLRDVPRMPGTYYLGIERGRKSRDLLTLLLSLSPPGPSAEL